MSYLRDYLPKRSFTFKTQGANAFAIDTPTHIREFKVTAAQINGLFVTPLVLLPAPGTNIAYLIERWVFEMTRTATAFLLGGAISLQYHTTTTSVPTVGAVAASVVTTGGAGVARIVLGPDVGASGLVLPANEGIDLNCATQAFTTGTGIARVFLQYKVIKF